MISVYDHDDYKVYFNAWVATLPKQGHGEYRKLSLHLNVSTTMISQVFRGEKHLSLELACDVSDYLGHNDLESEYFLLLVELNRAGSHKLREKLKKQVQQRQLAARKVENRIKKDFELSAEAKSVYYTSWVYSGLRLLTAVPGYNDVVTISERLQLPRATVQKAMDFLLQNRLVEIKKGKLVCSDVSTHVGSSTLLVNKHHQNWRLQGLQKMAGQVDSDLYYTGPTAMSKEAAEKIHSLILKTIEEYRKISGPSDSELVRCLNIDWFEY